MPRNRSEPEFRHVYFIEAIGLDMVKIGCADDASKRIRNLQVGSPVELRLLGVMHVDDAHAFEQQLHRQFSALHVRGEWFRIDQHIRDIFENLGDPQDKLVQVVTKPQSPEKPLMTLYRKPRESILAFARRAEREFHAALQAAA